MAIRKRNRSDDSKLQQARKKLSENNKLKQDMLKKAICKEMLQRAERDKSSDPNKTNQNMVYAKEIPKDLIQPMEKNRNISKPPIPYAQDYKPALGDLVPEGTTFDAILEMFQTEKSVLGKSEPTGEHYRKAVWKLLHPDFVTKDIAEYQDEEQIKCNIKEYPTSEIILSDSIQKNVENYIFNIKAIAEWNKSFERDYDLEGKIILMSKIELRLLATLKEHTGPYSWLPHAFKISKGYLVNEYKIISKTYEMNPRDDIMWVQQNLPMLKTYVDLLKEAIRLNREEPNELENDDDGNVIYDPQLNFNQPNGAIVDTLNVNVGNLNDKISTPDKIFFGRVIPPPGPLYFRPFIFSNVLPSPPRGNFNCFGLYCLINNLDEDTAISELMELENIDDGIFSVQGLFKRDSWYKSKLYNDFIYNNNNNLSANEFIDFKSSTGRSVGKVEINKSKDGYVLLPVTQWYRRGDERAFDLHLPFGKNVPLYNLDLIYKNESATIRITDNLLLAHQEISSVLDTIWTSWPNWPGEDSLKYVNLKTLLDKKVIYQIDLCQGKTRAYSKAMRHYVYLKEINDLSFFEDHPGRDDKRVLTREEFLGEAKKLGVYHKQNDEKKTNSNEKLSLHSAAEDVELQELQFIIKPIIPEKSIILLYSNFGVGKSFAALSWAYGVSQGRDICNRLEVPRERKILYIDSEMGKEIMQERIGYMKKIFGNESDKTDNFLWHSVASENQIQNINIADESGQNIIEELLDLALLKGDIGEPVSFLVLDNISTLTAGISNHSSWMKVFKWLYKIKSKCSVLILHHENRAGKYLGSVLQGITVDSKIHLFSPELKTREIEFDVVIDKARRTYGKAKAPFTTGIDLNSAEPKWYTSSQEEVAEKEKFKNMSKQEKYKYLKVLKDKLGDNKSIADFLGISLATLYNWKKELK